MQIIVFGEAVPSLSNVMNRKIDNSALAPVLERMGISDISSATIRQSGEIAEALIAIARPSVREELDRAARARFGYTYR